MKFRPRLVALDIDGTLVDEFSRMPRLVRDAVRRVVDADVPVVLATGRSWLATQPIFDELELPHGRAVSSNGAVVVDYPPLEIIHEERFDPSDSLRRIAELAPHALVGVEEGMKWRVTRPFPPGELMGDVEVSTLEEMASRPVSRIVLRDPDSTEEKFLELTRRLGLHEVAYFIGWSAWLDIAPQGVDKASGLEGVIEHYGVAREDVLAIGDGRNDIEMLEWAGRGVAMGNAPGDVKAAADHVTGHFHDGGTVAELQRWFPGRRFWSRGA